MADIGFIPLVFWHPNTFLVIHWRSGPVWALMEVMFVHYCVLQFEYCAVVVVGDFDAVEVCCDTVVACVEPEVWSKCSHSL
jgi:hypothetical protein